jgi:uncharacterized cupin superfamily protein
MVLEGEIDMLLDDSEVHLKAGDVLVQQGTNHAWVNRSGKVCRMAFVLIDAEDPLAPAEPRRQPAAPSRADSSRLTFSRRAAARPSGWHRSAAPCPAW